MKPSFSMFVGTALMAVLTASLSLAHTTAKTSPESGAVLAQSPATVEIRFEHEASLTSATVVEAGKPERKLEFAPKGSAKVFTLTNPNLSQGRSEIQWKALSKDGHVVSGKIVLTVDPKASKSG